MKLSLADIILQAIERSNHPLETPFLVQIAYAEGYKNPRSAVHVILKMLRLNGYIKPAKVGKGTKPSTWVPVSMPVIRSVNTPMGKEGKSVGKGRTSA